MKHDLLLSTPPRFPAGQVVTTQGAAAAAGEAYLLQCLSRHLGGDWGCCCAEDKATNDAAVEGGA